MTGSALPEALEAFPIPDDAVLLDQWKDGQSSRELTIAALHQELRRRQLALPLGPELNPADPERLLSLNRFALQLATAGLLADQVAVAKSLWRNTATAPQLLLAALVDEENGVVQLQGVLTAEELQQQLPLVDQEADHWLLAPSAFQGGLERLLTLVQLLEPQALPRLALAAPAAVIAPLVVITDWLRGQLDQALLALGAELQPASAAAFRSASAGELANGAARTVLAIPLGISPQGELVSGSAARQCIETFQLLLAPTRAEPGSDTPSGLMLRLTGALEGDLLPDGLTLQAQQGSHRQSATTERSSVIEFSFHGREPISVSLLPQQGLPLELPPLVLQRP